LAEEVRKYHIPDFSNWKNHAALERAFAQPTPARRDSARQAGWKKICARASANNPHPNGMKSLSPGLRGTSYPGSTAQNNFQPQRGCIRIRRKFIQPPSGLISFLVYHPA
jgi:hypothetical protein